MVEAVYVLCFLTSVMVFYLLAKAYFRTRTRFLLWCGLGFLGLCLNNLMLIFDRMIIYSVDLSLVRQFPALAGMSLLVFGLIWDGE